MAERRIPYIWVWIVFLAMMFVGAGLMTSDDPGRVRAGIAILVLPIAAFSALLGLYYWKSRRDAQ